MSTVSVMLGERSYPLRIKSGSVRQLGETLAQEFAGHRVVGLCASRSPERAPVEAALASSGLAVHILEVRDGIRGKSLRSATRIYDALWEMGADRQTLVVAAGGEPLCDLAGFVASTYLRGLPLVLVPTTLLAQIDSGIGGKTALNHRQTRNLLGTFYEPRLVCIDPELLVRQTAQRRRAGLLELVKLATIWDAELFAWLEAHVEALSAGELAALTHAVTRACQIKAEIVGLDEKHSGLRALLDFGRTSEADEDRAAGMIGSAVLSEALGWAPRGAAERLSALLGRAGFPAPAMESDEQLETHLQALWVDKGNRKEKLRMVVLRDIGRADVLDVSPEELLTQAP